LPTGERYFADLPPEARPGSLADARIRRPCPRRRDPTGLERGDQGMVDVLAELEEDDLLRD
jgi:hypothetical protein